MCRLTVHKCTQVVCTYICTYYTCVCMFVIHTHVLAHTHMQCFVVNSNCLCSTGPVETDGDMGGVDHEVRLPGMQ